MYVRNRGADDEYSSCFTCGAHMPVESLQCGHFRPRRYYSTRWHMFNGWPQCNRCNVELSGNLKVYEEKLRALYGDDAVDGIYELSYSQTKVTDDEIREIIKQFR